jgi:hypothetical protein
VKWKGRLLGVAIVAVSMTVSFSVGQRVGEVNGFMVGVQIGERSTINKIKEWCDGANGLAFNGRLYYCAPATKL